MKKSFKLYGIIWAIFFALFQLITFVTPGQIFGVSKFTPSFWISYGFITASFLGQLVCAYFIFRANSLKKFFYNISLISISYTGLVIMLIAGGLCMAIPIVPYWLGVIVCVFIVGLTAIIMTKAQIAIDAVTTIDEKVKARTFFIKSLTVDVEGLVAQAKSDVVKAECKKVYEAVRYSDPMSNDALAGTEGQITLKMNALSQAVAQDEETTVKSVTEDLLILLDECNKKCRLLK